MGQRESCVVRVVVVMQGVLAVLLLLAAFYRWIFEVRLAFDALAALWGLLGIYFIFSSYKWWREAIEIDQLAGCWPGERDE